MNLSKFEEQQNDMAGRHETNQDKKESSRASGSLLEFSAAQEDEGQVGPMENRKCQRRDEQQKMKVPKIKDFNAVSPYEIDMAELISRSSK